MPDIEAPIREVTVYSDRALITRRGSITLEAGEHELHVNNLPQFIRDSLRAAGQGPKGTRILNVDVTTAFFSRPPEAELRKLQDDLEQLQHQQQLLYARQESLQDRRKWLRALGEQSHDFAQGLARGQMKPQDCADFFGFMTQQSQQDAEAAQDLELQLRQLQLEIDAKGREIAQKTGNLSSDRQAAVVSVELASAGEFTLEISYLVHRASWHPQYDVRVSMNEDGNSGAVELLYAAQVQQATGEDWHNVSLALSTARPHLAAVAPEVKPWYLNVYTPPIRPMTTAPVARFARAMVAPGAAASVSEGVFAGAASDELEEGPAIEQAVEVQIATTTVESTGTALVFRAGRSVDIPSDNSPHKTAISHDHLPCEFDYVSAPALNEQVHLRATISNTTERILLKGDASIFLTGEYVGTTKVKDILPNETFKIFLGVDDTIKVKREPTERSVDKGNLLQNDLRRNTYAYLITVHNYAHASRTIVVHDHLPLSQHERIKVKIQTVQPQPSERTKLEILKWRFTLPLDGEQKIEYRFVVEYPQGMSITGLPPARE